MPSTGESWRALLDAMTDEELVRYGEIAGDQVKLEWRRGWLQMLALLAAAGLIGAGGLAASQGEVLLAGATVGLSAALSYWPYRKAKLRRLWMGHCRVVRSELEERRGPASGTRGAGCDGQGR